MELILKEDVQNLGFKDDMVTVKNGYARNYLIPHGMAQLATPSAKKVLAENLKQKAHKEKKIVAEANKMAEAIKALEMKITAKAGAGDKLFGSISNIDLAAALEKWRSTSSEPPRAVRVVAKVDGFRRAGMAHPTTPVEHPVENFADPGVLEALFAERQLTVDFV